MTNKEKVMKDIIVEILGVIGWLGLYCGWVIGLMIWLFTNVELDAAWTIGFLLEVISMIFYLINGLYFGGEGDEEECYIYETEDYIIIEKH